ncbi:MAG: intradiol ring-cleavage dioxygenase [Planctomycetota bacterium]|nr:intradiol ring-cleavage dioxygenase [Planctomycetota bacterium]
MTTDRSHEIPYFSEAESAEVVASRTAPDADARLAKVYAALVRHLHAFIKEVEPTQDEWTRGIEFLTETGHMSNDWRQEFILLSDTLGVSMLVDAINNRKPTGATESTVLGPFHVAGVPEYENGGNICLDGKGEPLVMSGTVTDPDGTPIAGAKLDIWTANDEGFYDVQQKDVQPEHNLRGIFTTDENGHYWLRAIKPRWYPVPDDGPVGKLIRALGRHPNRPAHIHIIAAAEGHESVTTHVFDPDCPWIHSDAVFGVKESLLGDFKHVDDAARAAELGVANPFWEVVYDVVLTRA